MASKYFSRQPRFLPEMPGGEIEAANPPSAYEKPDIAWSVILLPPAVMLIISVLLAITAQSLYMLISIATTLMTIIASLTTATSQIKRYKQQKQQRETKYLQYITDLRAELALSQTQQVSAMNEMHPPPSVCLQRINQHDSKLWERNATYNDFLSVRIGLGSVPAAVKIKYNKQPVILDNDPLALEPERLATEFARVKDVPVCVDLFASEICGVAGEEDSALALLRLAVLQLLTHHGYDDVKLVLLLKEESLTKWEWLRHLPHVWDTSFSTRYLLCGRAMAHQTLAELYELLSARELRAGKSGRSEPNLPHYVFIVEDSSLLENEVINKYLYFASGHLGVSTIFVDKHRAYLPMNCKVVINLQAGRGEYAHKGNGDKITFLLDNVELRDLERAARNLAPLRIRDSAVSFALPQSFTLLDMLQIERVEAVDILGRWQRNRTYRGMSVPIGARAGNETFHLDVHETGFGPHGLVAGTTGSGKSELLQSIIISLAINYHPYDVAFVLIDYKGGGMADVFAGLPHLVGTITNLDGNQTVRALVSIKSELQRRQRIFAEHGVNNIDKYQKLYHNGGAGEPLPHLIMIADEFAELKAEQPDFMKELVSTARVGRSLGVHLILATQKPAGVVDDQIWSNSKFKICLKVQDETDSQDVIKRPDAAMLKEPGRAYIQVGNDEFFELFQSTWSGADYDPEGERAKQAKQVKRIYKVQLNGKAEQIYPVAEDKIVNHEVATQLEAMVDYIRKQAEVSQIHPLTGPWLPPLPNVVYMDALYPQQTVGFDYEAGIWRGQPTYLCPPIGIVDNPREQSQQPLSLDFVQEGNLFVYGAPGTGKTVLLETLCLALAHVHTPTEVNLYLMAFGGTGLKPLAGLPHCGGVMTIEEENKINQFMQFMFRTITDRKRLFERQRVENFLGYKARQVEALPAIFLLIDNYFALAETYERVDEQMMVLAREGAKYGIYLVATATNATLVRYKFAVNFKMAISLQLTDKHEYDNIVGRTEGLEPAPVLGRALIRSRPPLELQISLPEFRQRDTDAIIARFAALVETGQVAKATPIPEMPAVIEIGTINRPKDGAFSTAAFAIGLADQDLQPVYLDLASTPTLMIAGDLQTGKSTVLMSWMSILLKKLGDRVRIYAQDSTTMGIYPMLSQPQVVDLAQVEDVYAFIEEIKAEIDTRREQLKQCKRNQENVEELLATWTQLIFVFDNLNDFTDTADFSLKELLERIVKKEQGLKLTVIAAGDTKALEANYDSFAKAVRDQQGGILLGSLKDQNLFGVRLPYGAYEKDFATMGDGYLIVKNKSTGLRLACEHDLVVGG